MSKYTEKYLSIITNFGCHYKCPYCIVKNNNLQIPFTTIKGLQGLERVIKENDINIISISGGGDPCYNYYLHKEWYIKLFDIVDKLNIPLELHTTYLDVKNFPYEKFERIVYHIRGWHNIELVHQHNNEKIRVVFVVTKDFTEFMINKIVKEVNRHSNFLELTFRQMVDENYKTTNYMYDYLKTGHKKKWWYVEQDDYNLYYAENKVSYKYEDYKLTK